MAGEPSSTSNARAAASGQPRMGFGSAHKGAEAIPEGIEAAARAFVSESRALSLTVSPR